METTPQQRPLQSNYLIADLVRHTASVVASVGVEDGSLPSLAPKTFSKLQEESHSSPLLRLLTTVQRQNHFQGAESDSSFNWDYCKSVMMTSILANSTIMWYLYKNYILYILWIHYNTFSKQLTLLPLWIEVSTVLISLQGEIKYPSSSIECSFLITLDNSLLGAKFTTFPLLKK